MPTGIKEGQGITITFGTTSVTLNLLDVTMSGVTRTDIETSDQDTTGYMNYIPSTLAEGGTFVCNVNWNLNDHNALMVAATTAAAETITFTYPKVNSADATAPTDAFTGYINSITKTVAKGSLINGTMTLKVADDISVTDGAT